MKTRLTSRFLLAFCMTLAFALPLAAQEGQSGGQGSDDYYYVTVPVEHIYRYHLGYVITYRKGPIGTGRVYLPAEWFQTSGGKGQLIPVSGQGAWPYLYIYYRNGEFSHVKMTVHASRAHPSWGLIPNSAEMDANFQNVDSVQLEFE